MAPIIPASVAPARAIDLGFAGQTGAKAFSDGTVPLGTTRATYIIIPWRGELVGPASSQFSVQFGVEDPAQTAGESSTGTESMGLAA